MPFQPVDAPDYCGMIDRELLGGSRDRSAAHDGEHETEVVPVEGTEALGLAALIQHFRTSMVHFIGLVSQEMQVKKSFKAISSRFQGEYACVPSGISSAAKRSRARRDVRPTFSSR